MPFPLARTSADKKKKVSTKGIVIRSPIPSSSSASSSESSLPRRVPGQYGSGPLIPASERLALPVEEEASVDQPNSPHPDPGDMQLMVVNKSVGEVVGPSCSKSVPPATTLVEEPGVERSSLPPCESNSLAFVPVEGPIKGRSRPPCDLTTGLNGRLQLRPYETIEVNYSSAREEHLEGNQTEIARGDPSGPVLIQDDDSSGDVHPVGDEMDLTPRGKPYINDSTEGDFANGASHISAGPPSCAELEEMLRQIPPGSDVDLPSTKMFESAEMVFLIFLDSGFSY